MVSPHDYYSSVKEALKQCLLVSFGIGNEGFLAGLFVLMVANLRDLDVPVAYTSLPSFIAALISGAEIAGLSVISEKYATSRRGKSCVLLLAVLFQYTGVVLVITGNMIKLKYDPDYVAIPSYALQPTEDVLLNDSHSNQRLLTNLSDETVTTFAPGANRSNCNSPLCQVEISPETFNADSPHFTFQTLIAMIGYTLIEGSYDPINCFLKTFALTCTPQDSHPTVLVKASSIASLGGTFITLLGSVSVGEWFFADSDTNYDANAAKTISLLGIALIISVLTLTVSLVTGIFSTGGGQFKAEATESSRCEGGTAEERQTLLPDTDSAAIEEDVSWSVSIKLAHSVLEKPSCLADEIKAASTKVHHGDKSRRGKVRSSPIGFLRQHSFTVILCAATYFAASGYFVFDMFSVNFVSIVVFQGDPASPATSEEFSNFMSGQEAASSGMMLFYLTFLIVGFFENAALQKFGWWWQTAGISVIYVVVSFSCGYFSELWLYYLTASLTGAFRLLVYIIPFVLITKVSRKRQATGDGRASNFNTDIALITAVSPISILLAAAVTGPLLSWTKNAATPIFTTTLTTAVSLFFFWLIRKY